MYFKSIFQGNLHLGNVKSFDKVVKMYDHRLENYYKNDVLFKSEEVFDSKAFSVTIPRTVINISEKTWRNTVNLLTYVAQFAVSGNIGVWMTEEGKIIKYAWIEPEGDKAVVQNFRKGASLIHEKGQESEAERLLTKAIEIYDKHAQAYERRGYVNYLLKKFHDAERDFTKAINLDKSNTPAYHGRARIKILQKEWEAAVEDLTLGTKTSLALQDLHWECRRLKADCLMNLKRYEEAEFELRFLTKRKFKTDSPNFEYRQENFYNYGLVLMELGRHEDAMAAFDLAMEIEQTRHPVSEAELLFHRGLARKESGKNGFISDWNEASKLGNKRASKLLETVR